MKLTPLDIKRHTFEKGFRGYNPDDVDGYLKRLADQFEALQEEVRLAHDRTRETEAKLLHYERVELALQEALESAKESAKRSEEDAQRRASVIVEEAELRAQQILQDVERERFGMKQDLVKLSARQAEVAARLRGFLVSELEILSDFQGDDARGLIQAASPAGLLSDGKEATDLSSGPDSADDSEVDLIDSASAPAHDAELVSEVPASPDEEADPVAEAPPAAEADSPPTWSARTDLEVPEPEPHVEETTEAEPVPTAASYVPPPRPFVSPLMPTPETADDAFDTGRVQISSNVDVPSFADESEVLGPPTPVADAPAADASSAAEPPAWSAPLGGNVAGSEAERERIRRILEDLD